MRKESALFKKYNQLLHPARVNFMQSHGINFFMCEMNPKKLHAFLLLWTVASIKMTERVEDWIKRAGEQCETKDLTDVGSRLKRHAEQEAGHDQMLVLDADHLLKKWNEAYNDRLTIGDILKLGSPQSTADYVALHEDAIKSDHPYVQTAIEYEIERISVVYGPRMIDNLILTLGEEFQNGITFLAEHVLLDQGHTKYNMDLMERCLEKPANIKELVATGTLALKIYSSFLNECVNKFTSIAERPEWKSQLAT